MDVVALWVIASPLSRFRSGCWRCGGGGAGGRQVCIETCILLYYRPQVSNCASVLCCRCVAVVVGPQRGRVAQKAPAGQRTRRPGAEVTCTETALLAVTSLRPPVESSRLPFRKQAAAWRGLWKPSCDYCGRVTLTSHYTGTGKQKWLEVAG